MGFTTLANQKLLNSYGQAASLAGPSTIWFGLLVVPNPTGVWTASHAYTSGQYVIPTTFDSISGQQGKIFKCTTSGTSGGTTPTFPTTAGGTVTDGGTLVWTECSLLFAAGTFTGAEASGSGYARQSLTANSTSFPNASSASPSVSSNGAAISGYAPTGDLGFAVGWIESDASTVGNLWYWGALSTHIDLAASSSPSFAISALQHQLTP